MHADLRLSGREENMYIGIVYMVHTYRILACMPIDHLGDRGRKDSDSGGEEKSLLR